MGIAVAPWGPKWWRDTVYLMAADPRTPVLVGVGTASQRLDDPTAAREPSPLMAAAWDVAADDSGARGLLANADVVLVPKGTWTYPDAARLVASAIGASGARTVVG